MQLQPGRASSLLKQAEAWQSGHFLLSSGLHSAQYIQCQKVLQYPRFAAELACELAAKVRDAGLAPTAVVGPALGAVHWELMVAQALDGQSEEPVRGIFAERPDGTEFEIRRGIELKPDEEVLVVEDVTTTGGSAKKVVELVRRLGATPVAVGTIIDRSGGSASFDLPFFSLMELTLDSHPPERCPQCAEGVPLIKPGTTRQSVR